MRVRTRPLAQNNTGPSLGQSTKFKMRTLCYDIRGVLLGK